MLLRAKWFLFATSLFICVAYLPNSSTAFAGVLAAVGLEGGGGRR
jgi:hypothetical protein